ncbi:C6 zinc finger domain containing protein [Botrytis cinerea]
MDVPSASEVSSALSSSIVGQENVTNARRAPKSRQGCQRCKTKRLKCDEKKPYCLQCLKRKAECCYASQRLVWSTKHEKILVEKNDRPLPSSAKALKRELEIGLKPSVDQTPGRGMTEFNTKEDDSEIVKHAESCDGSQNGSVQSPETPVRRLSTPNFTDSLSAIRYQLSNSTVPEFLVHLPTMLVEYYFGYICVIFSSFDGIFNPFRSTVGQLWDDSAPIYYAIQSMAAAYLSHDFPRMSVPCWVESHDNIDKTLLTVLLVGQTTAWHNPRDLGLAHLKTAKRLYKQRLSQQGANSDNKVRRQNEFFQQCILYWDLLAGFVEDEENIAMLEEDSTLVESATGPNTDHQIFPHPWTGVAPKVQGLFAQVGRLIRSYRKSTFTPISNISLNDPFFDFNSIPLQSTVFASIEWTNRARHLEEKLLAVNLPTETELVDAGDENTPVRQYILLAEAYRCAALLEIYRIFPSIYLNRQPDSQEILSLPVSHSVEEFLISLALHVTSLLEKIPSTSGTRCLQPIVMIVAASELKFSTASMNEFSIDTPFGASQFGGPGYRHCSTSGSAAISSSITNFEVDIAAARRFIITRFQEFKLSLPAKPMAKALILIEETWARADIGQEVFWSTLPHFSQSLCQLHPSSFQL